ncbi:MAG: hypothetical protein MJ182_02020 [Treponema sp.]|nr:hypothetical protein [Treponema sp.]
MLKLKKLISLLFCCFIVTSVYASGKISEACEKMLYEMFEKRIQLTSFDSRNSSDCDKALKILNQYYSEKNSELEKLVPEEKVILESFFAMEHYTYQIDLASNDSEKEVLKNYLKPYVDQMEKICSGKKDSELSFWLLTVRSDLLSCYISVSSKDVMKYGLSIKSYYEEALEQNPDFFLANANIGQWYYWAPAIGGGSKKKGLGFCENGYKQDLKPAYKFYPAFHYSQMLYANKNKEKAAAVLNEILALYPESQMVLRAKKLNENGKSYYEGTGFKLEN